MNDGASPEAIARRVVRDLAGAERVWVAPALTHIHARWSQPPALGELDVAVVSIEELALSGEYLGTVPPAPATRVLGVLRPPWRIVTRLSRRLSPCPAATRVFGAFGVIDVQPPDLVIVELAVRVSAIDLQKHAEPTLKISSRVTVMHDNVGAEDR